MRKKTLPLIALVLMLAAIGGLLWLVLSPPGSDERAPVDPDSALVEGAAPVEEAAPSPGRRRARRQGRAVVHGEVRLSRGETPVPGQSVTLTRPDAEPWSVETDAAGAFEIVSLPHGGPYELRIAAEGYATVRLPGIALDRGEKRDVGTLWLDQAVRAEVRVRSLADVPLPGAEVRAFAAPTLTYDWSRTLAQLGVEPIAVAAATTDAEGRATFPELAAGSWTFTAAKEGFAMRGRPALQLRAGDDRKPLTIYLGRGYALTGRVTNQDGEGVANALLLASPPNVAWSPQVAPLRQRAIADATGRYELSSLSAGDTVIYAGRPDAPPGPVGTVRVPAVATFDVVLREGGVLRGTVTLAATGEPAAGAIVRASCFGGGGSRGGNSVAETLTDEEGTYSIASLAEGTVNSLRVEKEGYIASEPEGGAFRAFPLRRGDTVVRDLQLRTGTRLTGTVRAPAGPVAGARLTAFHGGRSMQRKSVTADSEGRYSFEALLPGPAVVQSEVAGYYQVDFPANWWQLLRGGENRNKVVLVDGVEASLDVELGAGGAIEGRVETLEGDPVAGARVSAAVPGQGRGRPRPSATSGEDGSFRIEGLTPSPRVNLAAQKRGFGSLAPDPVVVAAGEATTGVLVRLAPLPTVTGRVTTLDGAPVEDAYVQLQHQAAPGVLRNLDPSLFFSRTARFPVRPDGTYELLLPGVEGTFTVQASAPGLPTVTSEKTTLSTDRSKYEVDLTFPAGDALRGIVVAKESGEPIAGAWVRINQERMVPRDGVMSSVASGPTIVAVTDADGLFVVEALQRGKHRVHASAEGRVDDSQQVDLPATSQLRFALPAEMSISGEVRHDGGTPVVGARVTARLADGTDNRPQGRSTTTDGSGSFEVQGLARGTYQLTVSPDWAGSVNILELKSDSIDAGADDIRLVARAGKTISGRVIDPDRKPVGGAMINANPKLRREGVRSRRASTKPDGSFEVVGLVDGAYTISVRTIRGVVGGTLQPGSLEAAAGATGLEIVLHRGLSIDGVLLGTDGKPIAGVWLAASAIGDGMKKINVPASIDESGRFKITGLEAGRYRLEARVFDAKGAARLILPGGAEVTAGATALRLTASKGASISGVVVDEDGQPVIGARVVAATQGGGSAQSVRTTAGGRFDVRGLPEGSPLTVSATAEGFIPSEPLERLPGDTLRIELLRGLSAGGVVLDADGATMKRARLTLSHSSGASTNVTTDHEGRFTAGGLQPGVYEVVVRVPDPSGAKRLVRRPCGVLRAGETGATLQVR